MHYFKRNIGDYHKKAGRLTMLQHGAYTLLIDACYDRETFPTIEQAIDWCWACTKPEIEAVKFVINKFFTLNGELYEQSRIQEEIDKYHENAAKNKQIALDREARKREKSTNRAPIVNEPPPNQEPLTTNHKPIKKKSENKFSDADISFAKFMYEKILIIAERTKEPNFESWANTIRLMRQIDNYDPGEIQQVFCWANIDTFWQSNIKSPAKLRDKYATLHSQMNNRGNGNGQPSGSRKLTAVERIREAGQREIERTESIPDISPHGQALGEDG